MQTEIDTVHKAFEIMNNIKEIHTTDVMLQNTADELGITKSDLTTMIDKYNLYIWDNSTKSYIRK